MISNHIKSTIDCANQQIHVCAKTSGSDITSFIWWQHSHHAECIGQVVGVAAVAVAEQQDALPGQDPWEDSVMMVFGNVFAFNAALVRNMRREWPTIGQATCRRLHISW